MTNLLSRRGFLLGALATPAIIPINRLMKLSVPAPVYTTRTISLAEYAALTNGAVTSLCELLAKSLVEDTVIYGIALTRFDPTIGLERYDHANRKWRPHNPRAIT